MGRILLVVFVLGLLSSCERGRFGSGQIEMPADVIIVNPEANAERNAYYGDLHVHTTYSFDAFVFGTVATPDDAYRYAKGEKIKHPGGFDVQLRKPLDFYAVTDHAMFIGAAKRAADTSTEFSKIEPAKNIHDLNAPDNLKIDTLRKRLGAFRDFLVNTLTGVARGEIELETINDVARDAWADTVRAAEEHNDPGKFTTFVGYEYTSSTNDRGNLHRNVIFRGADKLPAMPFSRFHSQNPEGLWDWLDGLRDQGIEALAIPHNSNGSNGQMFKMVDWARNAMDDDYTKQRIRNEPLIELTQVKGTSETHPLLSPNDEWADFEIAPYRVATVLYSEPSGSYAREALLNGLVWQERGITNPYKFGFVAASDTHVAAMSDDESNFFMKVGLLDSTAELRGSVPLSQETRDALGPAPGEGGSDSLLTLKEVDGKEFVDGAQITFGASGFAAVWAEENTRDAIYNAFRRKETFATSGTRIKVRFFGSYDFDNALLSDKNVVARAYAEGVSMGSDLLAEKEKVPTFVVWAVQDPMSAPLQRLQIIKGWVDNGDHNEEVYDVACSDGNEVDPDTHRCPDNGAKVNLEDCSISTDVGAAELKASWTDPDYNPQHHAFYYVRVLENPTCRWSTWDALRAGTTPRSDYPLTIQERAWTSPIWLIPDSN